MSYRIILIESRTNKHIHYLILIGIILFVNLFSDTVKVEALAKKIQENMLRRLGHVKRRDENYLSKRIERIRYRR